MPQWVLFIFIQMRPIFPHGECILIYLEMWREISILHLHLSCPFHGPLLRRRSMHKLTLKYYSFFIGTFNSIVKRVFLKHKNFFFEFLSSCMVSNSCDSQKSAKLFILHLNIFVGSMLYLESIVYLHLNGRINSF